MAGGRICFLCFVLNYLIAHGQLIEMLKNLTEKLSEGIKSIKLIHAVIFVVLRPYLPDRPLPKAPALGHNHTHTPKPLNSHRSAPPGQRFSVMAWAYADSELPVPAGFLPGPLFKDTLRTFL